MPIKLEDIDIEKKIRNLERHNSALEDALSTTQKELESEKRKRHEAENKLKPFEEIGNYSEDLLKETTKTISKDLSILFDQELQRRSHNPMKKNNQLEKKCEDNNGNVSQKRDIYLNKFEKEGKVKTWLNIVETSAFAGLTGGYFSHISFDAPVIGGLISIALSGGISYLVSRDKKYINS